MEIYATVVTGIIILFRSESNCYVKQSPEIEGEKVVTIQYADSAIAYFNNPNFKKQLSGCVGDKSTSPVCPGRRGDSGLNGCARTLIA